MTMRTMREAFISGLFPKSAGGWQRHAEGTVLCLGLFIYMPGTWIALAWILSAAIVGIMVRFSYEAMTSN